MILNLPTFKFFVDLPLSHKHIFFFNIKIYHKVYLFNKLELYTFLKL